MRTPDNREADELVSEQLRGVRNAGRRRMRERAGCQCGPRNSRACRHGRR